MSCVPQKSLWRGLNARRTGLGYLFDLSTFAFANDIFVCLFEIGFVTTLLGRN